MLQPFHEQNRDLIVNINGRLVHRDEAGVSPFDSSVQNGDAVWEGLRVYDGRIFRLTEHLARLRKSATMLAYESIPTDDEITTEIKRTLEANRMRDNVHIRLTLSRGLKYTSGLDPRINQYGHSLFVLAEHKPPVFDKKGIRLLTASVRRPPADVLNQHIHSCNQLTSILAKLEASRAGADDALLLDTRGFIAETSSTHVFLVTDGRVDTPTTAACPEGITRSVILELCQQHAIPHDVRDLPPDAIDSADEMFCTGTMGEIVPVVEVDGRSIGDESTGPVTQRLNDLFNELTRREGVVVA